MRVWCAAAAGCGILLSGVFALAQAPDLRKLDVVMRSVPDGPVARVNNTTISREEFIAFYQNDLAAAMSGLHTSAIPDRIRVQAGIHALGALLQRELLYQEAAKRKLTVTDDEVEKHWAADLDRLKKGLPGPQDKDLPENEILTRAGLNRNEALAALRKVLLVNKVREQIAGEQQVGVTDAEVAKFFEENKDKLKQPECLHLQQIFVSTRAGKIPLDDKKKTQARERIDTALKRIQAGESFEAVAKAVSEAPDKVKGGDMGTLPVAALPPFFTQAAASMRPGDISPVIESELGLHLFKLIEVAPGSEPAFDKVAPGIRALLRDEKIDKAVDEFCKPFLEKPGVIRVYLQLEKTLATEPGFEDMKGKKGAGKEAPEKSPKAKESAAKDTSKEKPAKTGKAKAKKPSSETGAN
jgi:hypothetical protein